MLIAHIQYILACHLKIDADPDPSPDYHFDADPDTDPDPTLQFLADTCGSASTTLDFFFSYISFCKSIQTDQMDFFVCNYHASN
jgi:hypothetical protein